MGRRAEQYVFHLGAKITKTADALCAHHVDSLRTVNNRLIVASIEPRIAIGEWDAALHPDDDQSALIPCAYNLLSTCSGCPKRCSALSPMRSAAGSG